MRTKKLKEANKHNEEDPESAWLLPESYKDKPQDVMLLGTQAVLNQYSSKMREEIGEFMHGDRDTQEEIKTELAMETKESQISIKSSTKEGTDEEKDAKVVEILQQSETYMQENLNAVCNNMSLLTLHTFEFGHKIEHARDEEKDAKVVEILQQSE